MIRTTCCVVVVAMFWCATANTQQMTPHYHVCGTNSHTMVCSFEMSFHTSDVHTVDLLLDRSGQIFVEMLFDDTREPCFAIEEYQFLQLCFVDERGVILLYVSDLGFGITYISNWEQHLRQLETYEQPPEFQPDFVCQATDEQAVFVCRVP